MRGHHLTEEEFTELLVGEAGRRHADVREHLVECVACRTELEQVSAAMGSFETMSLQWAEREAPARVRVPRPWELLRIARPAWGLATASLVAAGIVFGMHQKQPKPMERAADSIYTETAIAQDDRLTQDNRLMQEIDREVEVQEDSPVPVAALGIDEGGRRAQAAHRVSN